MKKHKARMERWFGGCLLQSVVCGMMSSSASHRLWPVSGSFQWQGAPTCCGQCNADVRILIPSWVCNFPPQRFQHLGPSIPF
jgi:hypothetical protein